MHQTTCWLAHVKPPQVMVEGEDFHSEMLRTNSTVYTAWKTFGVNSSIYVSPSSNCLCLLNIKLWLAILTSADLSPYSLKLFHQYHNILQCITRLLCFYPGSYPLSASLLPASASTPLKPKIHNEKFRVKKLMLFFSN